MSWKDPYRKGAVRRCHAVFRARGQTHAREITKYGLPHSLEQTLHVLGMILFSLEDVDD